MVFCKGPQNLLARHSQPLSWYWAKKDVILLHVIGFMRSWLQSLCIFLQINKWTIENATPAVTSKAMLVTIKQRWEKVGVPGEIFKIQRLFLHTQIKHGTLLTKS